MTGDPLIARPIASANHVFPLCSASDHFNWQLSHGGLISGRLKAGAAGRSGSSVEGDAKHDHRKSAAGFPRRRAPACLTENCGVSRNLSGAEGPSDLTKLKMLKVQTCILPPATLGSLF